MSFRRDLLWVDCGAGFIAGVALISLAGWLSSWYVLPRPLLVGMGVGNLAYAAFSFSLARRRRRPRALLTLLVVANATWAVLCGLAAVLHVDTASILGLAHLVGEGIFVGGLAGLEWRQREGLLVAS